MTAGVTSPGSASLEINVVSGQSAATSAYASTPLKLLVPQARGASVWAYLGSFGGGIVAGDQTAFDLRIGPGARGFVTTQGLTRIYRNPRGWPCTHRLNAVLGADSLLVLAPEPIQPFAGSAYTQRQAFHLQQGAGLVMLDWLCAGLAACGERWKFSRVHSSNEVFLDGKRVLLDSLLLDQAHGPLPSQHRLGRFNCLAFVVVIGDSLTAASKSLLAAIDSRPVETRAPLLISASPLRNGALVRIAGDGVETVGREIRRLLGFVPALLHDDPWSRKW